MVVNCAGLIRLKVCVVGYCGNPGPAPRPRRPPGGSVGRHIPQVATRGSQEERGWQPIKGNWEHLRSRREACFKSRLLLWLTPEERPAGVGELVSPKRPTCGFRQLFLLY